jgi:prepilin-type N-terminal cleavage/methylation domain-containing protein
LKKVEKKEGFTLIEILVVIAIIAILAAIAIPQLSVHRTKSYNTSAAADIKNASIAQEGYYVENRTYCSDLNTLRSSPYNFYITRGVNLNIVSANDTAYLLNAYHSSGNVTYTLSGPGGSIGP